MDIGEYLDIGGYVNIWQIRLSRGRSMGIGDQHRNQISKEYDRSLMEGGF